MEKDNKISNSSKTFLEKLISFPLFKTKKKVVITLLILIMLGFFGWQKITGNTKQPQYQTAVAEKGTLITSVSTSGLISAGSGANITTLATGIVKEVYVKNGDHVTQDQKIAEITLDQDSKQRQQSAWASYLSAQNSLNSSKAKMNSLQAALFVANQKFMTDRGVTNPSDQQKADPVYIEENATWLQAEADYVNQSNVISQAQASLTSSWLSYQQISSTIIAPVDGTITNLIITRGLSIASSQGQAISTGNSGSLQILGSITPEGGQLQATVNLSEIDISKIRSGQKATLTLDAFPNKTFTGKISSINTNGIVSSGVTNYPATITLDTAVEGIYPNMTVSATIITNVKDNAILVPSGAVQTNSGQSSIRVMKNGQVASVSVEIGGSNDTLTEVTSGINEGDVVVTGTSTPTGTSSQGTASPFGGLGGGRGFGGGGGFGGNRGAGAGGGR